MRFADNPCHQSPRGQNPRPVLATMMGVATLLECHLFPRSTPSAAFRRRTKRKRSGRIMVFVRGRTAADAAGGRFVAGRRSASRDAAAPRCARRGSSADENHHSPTPLALRWLQILASRHTHPQHKKVQRETCFSMEVMVGLRGPSHPRAAAPSRCASFHQPRPDPPGFAGCLTGCDAREAAQAGRGCPIFFSADFLFKPLLAKLAKRCRAQRKEQLVSTQAGPNTSQITTSKTDIPGGLIYCGSLPKACHKLHR